MGNRSSFETKKKHVRQLTTFFLGEAGLLFFLWSKRLAGLLLLGPSYNGPKPPSKKAYVGLHASCENGPLAICANSPPEDRMAREWVVLAAGATMPRFG